MGRTFTQVQGRPILCHGPVMVPCSVHLFQRHLGLPVTLQLPDKENDSLGKETEVIISSGSVRRWNNWMTFDDLVNSAQNGRPGSTPVPSSAAAPGVV